ncbi:HPr family phosphocarrier protein [Ectobacillus funiculus]|uniref:HPr family phosphocarrier protein n=1 Tax=Ectobacillus funiculus TaxID=137993 RepID=UPI00397AB714
MIEKKMIVQLSCGLQARHAAKFVQKASSFHSEIHVINDGRLVDGKSILGVMTMAARKGTEITLLVNGSDEQKAIMTLEYFLSSQE